MIGERHRTTKIDYTGVSTPFTVENVYADLQDSHEDNESVDAFVMWEQQWDHLLKRADIDDENSSYVYDDGKRWLWGVRVELADEADIIAPVLKVRSELTDEEVEEIQERFQALVNTKDLFVHALREKQLEIVEKAKQKRG